MVAQRLTIRTLGGLEIALDGEPVTGFDQKKVAALLVYLAASGRAHPREILAEMLWEERTQSRSLANLRVVLTSLRQQVGDFVTITRQTVGMNPESDHWLDAAAFESLLAQDEQTVKKLETAVDLYGGDFLAGFYVDSQWFEDWTLLERESLRFDVMEALDALIIHHAAQGDYRPGIKRATQLLRIDPLREETHRQLMLLLACSGQRAAALSQYETCQRILDEELGMQPIAETTDLYERIQAGEIRRERSPVRVREQEAGLEPAAPVVKSNLPRQSTSFIGRESEVAGICKRLGDPDCRLLTLVGPGGIGKTRLALAVAERKVDDFANGAFFVNLAPLSSPDAIVSTVASALGFQFYQSQDDPQTQLLNYLREKEMLLVLDNFEHLLDGVGLVDAMLTAAPGVKVIVTSREVLNLGWEWLFEVQGMGYLQDGERSDGNSDYSAIRLFVERARRAQSDFSFKENRACVARVCQLVGGMPLGIELAAGWLRALSCEEVVAEIEASLDILETEQRDVPDRHRSIRVVFEPCWQRLSGAERDALMSLSVFRGGFTREAAEQVAEATLYIRMALLNKSLLQRDPQTHRYAMHELLRQYSEEQLEAAGEANATRDAHSEYYCAFVHHYQTDYEALEAEWLNLTAGLAMAYEHRLWALCLDYVGALQQMWFDRARYTEARQGLAWAYEAACAQRDRAGQAEVLRCWGEACIEQNDYDEARHHLERSLRHYHALGDQGGKAAVGTGLGRVAIEEGRFDDAQPLLAESRTIYEQIGNNVGLAHALYLEADIPFYQGDFAAARQLAERALRLHEEANDHHGCIRTLNLLVNVAVFEQEYDLAVRYGEEALHLCNLSGEQADRAAVLYGLAGAYRRRGDLPAARNAIAESMDLLHRMGDRLTLTRALRQQGEIHYHLQEYNLAEGAYQRSLVLGRELDHLGEQAYTLVSLGTLHRDRGQIPVALTMWQEAQALLEASTYPAVPGLADKIARHKNAAGPAC